MLHNSYLVQVHKLYTDIALLKLFSYTEYGNLEEED